jgi:hypothetical protein
VKHSVKARFNKVHQTDMLENDLKDTPTTGTSLDVLMGASSFEMLKLITDRCVGLQPCLGALAARGRQRALRA